MKNPIKAVICMLMIATTPMFAAGTQQSEKNSLKTGIYISKDGRLNINVDNQLNRIAKILIKDSNDQVVYQKNTKSETSLSTLKLDIDNLPDGEYKVEISNGRDKISQNVQLATPKSERTLVVGKL